MTRKRLSEAEIAAIEELRGRGWSYERIGRKIGRSHSTVEYACRHYVIEVEGRPPAIVAPAYRGKPVIKCRDRTIRRFSPEEDAELLALAKQGVNNMEIGRRLGRLHQSIAVRLETLARLEDRRERAGLQEAA
ncbi:MAG TPA: helix-turn-helix domain-containing protein [Dongiaceae bacterium]|nr:helix-turn-helix domain-containing protein [Dongiaceae bacterium]